ncbi:hypothetical protein ALP03_100807 [Pseudomonas amygdali pv. tabaci]|uniref:SSU ribosomal protein S2p n=1 Tax=Pseudomonas amygdali pv. tabaci TaxID=322 RepID=A0A3M6HWF1_PSEAJ|nr:hypothetical protein ALP03_100807 [Pseudomonas amygdali pv. tabaci]
MAEVKSFINARTQTFETLKANIGLSGNSKAKFNILNSHIAGSVVIAGELVIVGDPSTPSCTSQEAYLMAKASQIHTDLLSNGAGGDDFFLDNFELLQSLLSHASTGVGAATDGWNKHLNAIKTTLDDIEILHREHLSSGSMVERDTFYAKRTALFLKLDKQLSSMASYGSGLRNEGSIKKLLGISTSSYMHTGEISGYADKVSGVARAANLVKRGAYIGTALDVASTGLSIHKACTLGREEECKKAKYVEGSSLLGSLSFGAIGGTVGSGIAGIICVGLSIPTGGGAALACAVIGGAAGGMAGGALGTKGGEMMGDYLYRQTSP